MEDNVVFWHSPISWQKVSHISEIQERYFHPVAEMLFEQLGLKH